MHCPGVDPHPLCCLQTVCIEKNLGLGAGIRHILAESGPMGLYKGVFATILKQSSNQGLRFMAFNKYKVREVSRGDTRQDCFHNPIFTRTSRRTVISLSYALS